MKLSVETQLEEITGVEMENVSKGRSLPPFDTLESWLV